ncbi:MAG: AgmX/PglI C-terminal domain-containing protein, partial [Pseudomonadota bacterium]|nr:AgmX/PglI C-terminal domain-containing protein [Pseudomonadota bacterium]
RILRLNLVIFLVLSLVIPILPLTRLEKQMVEELPPRLAKLMLEKKPVPPPPKPQPVISKPKPVPKQVEKPKPRPKPKAKPQQGKLSKPAPVKKTISARKQAEQSGLLALKDTLQDLRQNTTATSLRQTRALSHAGGQARKTERAILTAGTTSGSGGIKTAGLTRNTGGNALASRATTKVHSPMRNATGGSGAGKTGKSDRKAGRSIEEIQMIFDRNKGAIYSVYNRALRKDPTLQGKIVLRLTIAPNGKVTFCELVSSELHDAVLGQKISKRVKLFDFGVKDVDAVTITYPIDFLPA